MATSKTITTDAAVVARQRMLSAGNNDKEYGAAFEALVDAKATTLEGVAAKIEAFRSYLCSGDMLSLGAACNMVKIQESVVASVEALLFAPRGKAEMFFE